MQRTWVSFVLALAAAAGCAAPTPTPIPPSHPASPAAPEAVLLPASRALAPEPDEEASQNGGEAGAAPSAPHEGHSHAH